MATLAAMRAGAGYVTVAAPGSGSTGLLHAAARGDVPSGCPRTTERSLPRRCRRPWHAVGRADAVVLGPGLGPRARRPGARTRAGAADRRPGCMIDADGLNALAGRLDELRHLPLADRPHAARTGELGRLLEVDSVRGRAGAAAPCPRRGGEGEGASWRSRATTRSWVAPSGRVAISPGGAPALATAGTGDVLSGVTGAMLREGVSSPAHAACAAVYVHLRAGQAAAEPNGPDGVIASDVIAALPSALASVGAAPRDACADRRRHHGDQPRRRWSPRTGVERSCG